MYLILSQNQIQSDGSNILLILALIQHQIQSDGSNISLILVLILVTDLKNILRVYTTLGLKVFEFIHLRNHNKDSKPVGQKVGL